MLNTVKCARRSIVALFAGAVLVTVSAGCSGSNLVAPKNPGSAADLVGTSWTNRETKVLFNFTGEDEVEMIDPSVPNPVYGSFELNDGMLDIEVGMRTFVGTWNGDSVVLEGTALVKN